MQSIFEVSQNYEDEGDILRLIFIYLFFKDTESNSFLDDNYMLRIHSAPARPITELEEFKR